MQAIVARYHGPTDTKGPRITAKASAGKIVMPYDHSLNIEDNHATAANALAARYGWLEGFDIASGCLPSGDFCHVLIDARSASK